MLELKKSYDWDCEQLQSYKQLISFFPNSASRYEKDIKFFEDRVRTIEGEIRAAVPSRTDGVIDIIGSEKVKKHYDELDNEYYFIALHNGQFIGCIEYRGLHSSDFGDIGYKIDEEYRGNGYAFRALSLLGDILLENGLEETWIAALASNLPSTRTIEKYGGTPIKSYPYPYSDGETMVIYSITPVKKELQGTARQFTRPQS